MSEEINCLVDHGNNPCNCFRNIAVNHECKWKSLAGELLKAFEGDDQEKWEEVAAKAKEMGL